MQRNALFVRSFSREVGTSKQRLRDNATGSISKWISVPFFLVICGLRFPHIAFWTIKKFIFTVSNRNSYVVDESQKGFVPHTVIQDATMLLSLIAQYIDDDCINSKGLLWCS